MADLSAAFRAALAIRLPLASSLPSGMMLHVPQTLPETLTCIKHCSMGISFFQVERSILEWACNSSTLSLLKWSAGQDLAHAHSI